MKLVRFGDPDRERPGVLLDDGRRLDLSETFGDWDHDFFHLDGVDALRDWLEEQDPDTLPTVDDDTRWGAPVPRPGKVVAVAANYADHAAESGKTTPPEPMLFCKAPNSVCGPYDPTVIPRCSSKTDWEVELALVIGRDARYVESPAAAGPYIAGYLLADDVSEREFQIDHCGQFVKGKSADSFCPLGPFLVTADELPDATALPMRLRVNDELMQDGNTGNMVFKPDYLVYYISQYMTLEAGDVICTGTPAGVGAGKKPPRFLRAGDVVELEVDGLGQQRHLCVAAD